MKKIWVFFGLIFIILIACLFINLSFLRPQIQKAIHENTVLSLDFKSAELTLFTGIGIELKDVVIKNNKFSQEEPFLSFKRLHIAIHPLSLLKGDIGASLHLNNPSINLVRKKEETNYLNLVKDPSVSEEQIKSSPSKSAVVSKDSKATSSELPWFVRKLVVESVDIKDLHFVFKDWNYQKNNYSIYSVKKLNLLISDIGLMKKTNVEFKTESEVNTEDLVLKGPITMSLRLEHTLKNNAWLSSYVTGELGLNDYQIGFKNLFKKSAGEVMTFGIEATVDKTALVIKKFDLNLKNLVHKTTLMVGFQKEEIFSLMSHLTCPDLKSLGELFPQHKNLIRSGDLNLNIIAKGDLKNILKTQVDLSLKSHIGSSSLDLNTHLNSLDPLFGNLQVKSNLLDLNSLLPPAQTSKNVDEKPVVASEAKTPEKDLKQVIKETMTPLVALIREKTKNINVSASVHVNEILYQNSKHKNLDISASVNQSILTLQKFYVESFDGKIAIGPVVFALRDKEEKLTADANIQGVKAESIFTFLYPPFATNVKGGLTFTNETKWPYVTNGETLQSKGVFEIKDGFVAMKSFTKSIDENFKTALPNLSSGNGGLMDKALQNETVQKFLGQKSGGDGKLSLSGLSTALFPDDFSLKELKVFYELRNLTLFLSSEIKSPMMTMSPNISVSYRKELGGTIPCITSPAFKDKLVSQNEQSKMLFDDKGQMAFTIILSGTVDAPKMKYDFSQVQKNILKNGAKKAVDSVMGGSGHTSSGGDAASQIKDKAKDLLKKFKF